MNIDEFALCARCKSEETRQLVIIMTRNTFWTFAMCVVSTIMGLAVRMFYNEAEYQTILFPTNILTYIETAFLLFGAFFPTKTIVCSIVVAIKAIMKNTSKLDIDEIKEFNPNGYETSNILLLFLSVCISLIYCLVSDLVILKLSKYMSIFIVLSLLAQAFALAVCVMVGNPANCKDDDED